jgi:hypothetical protein
MSIRTHRERRFASTVNGHSHLIVNAHSHPTVNGQNIFDPDHKHSMTNGGWLVIDTDQKDLRNNAIYVFRRAGEATVKLFIDDGKPRI